MGKTTIAWCEKTWNPVRAKRKADGKIGWFCTKVSSACSQCYAEHQNVMGGTNPGRYGNGVRYAVDQQKLVDIYVDEKTLLAPLHWKAPAKIFPCSMTDIYGEWVPDEWLYQLYAVMALTRQHRYIVLTKRSERRKEFLTHLAKSIAPLEKAARGIGYSFKFHDGETEHSLLPWPIPSIIEMASFGTQAEADREIPFLLETPAATRGVSAEPLLEYVDLAEYAPGLDWAIVGGESGSTARPCELQWAEAIRRQCATDDAAFFMKQSGTNAFWEGQPIPKFDRKGGEMDAWPASLRVRQWPVGM